MPNKPGTNDCVLYDFTYVYDILEKEKPYRQKTAQWGGERER